MAAQKSLQSMYLENIIIICFTCVIYKADAKPTLIFSYYIK